MCVFGWLQAWVCVHMSAHVSVDRGFVTVRARGLVLHVGAKVELCPCLHKSTLYDVCWCDANLSAALPLIHFLSSLLQLQHMMVMTGYPDFLLKPELIDQEYGVSHKPPISLCTVLSQPHSTHWQITHTENPFPAVSRCLCL